ncbi:MAG TPA: glutathione S-transferase family protein [Burkholderiales bacterium]|nr:glutathione S-transferase family protein [Burkholderiales bacterium]
MKLYMHPVSMTSRPVRLFIAENNIRVDEQVVDLMKGEHTQPPFTTINPNRQVPVLEDEGFRLTESSAILKYLADKVSSPAYPKDLKQRAKVNEMMDWLNTQFYREYGYGFIYPQIFPNNKRPTDVAQQACLDWAREKATQWLQILDQHWIGPRAGYLCGDKITIADYLGAGFVSLGEIIGMDFAAYPNIRRWLDNMKKLRSWPKVNEVFYGFRDALKEQKFVTL